MTEQEEIWKDLGFMKRENYSVSNKGRVKNNKTGNILKGNIRSDGYHVVGLYKNSKEIKESVHRLVLIAFVGYPEDPKMTVDHINQIRHDNRLENLRWATRRAQNENRTITEEKFKNMTKGRKVIQYKKIGDNHEIIKIWSNRKEAADNLNIESRRICDAVKEDKEYAGSYWKNVTEEDLPGEIWKPVVHEAFKDVYVSSCGRIRTKTGVVTCGKDTDGYRKAKVRVNGKEISKGIHDLVMEAFVGPSDLIVNHKDRDRSNNRLENLEYITFSNNARHAHETGYKHNYIPVAKYDLQDKLVAIYKGVIFAEESIGFTDLSNALSKRYKTTGGFKWKYLKEIFDPESSEYKIVINELEVKTVINISDYFKV